MNTLTIDLYSHRAIKKDGTQFLITEEDRQNWKAAKKAGYGRILIFRDFQRNIVFEGSADLIEECVAIDIKREQRIQVQKQSEVEYVEKSVFNTESKLKWTEQKLSELSEEECKSFVDQAKKQKGNVSDSITWATALLLIRKKYNCPFK